MEIVTWKLTGQPAGAGHCEQCGRELAFRYEVTSGAGGAMVVGRGCLKVVTGWTLTAAQAARELKMIKVRAQRAVNWAAFTAAFPAEAAVIDTDRERYRGQPAACHEVWGGIADGIISGDMIAGWAASYLARREVA